MGACGARLRAGCVCSCRWCGGVSFNTRVRVASLRSRSFAAALSAGSCFWLGFAVGDVTSSHKCLSGCFRGVCHWDPVIPPGSVFFSVAFRSCLWFWLCCGCVVVGLLLCLAFVGATGSVAFGGVFRFFCVWFVAGALAGLLRTLLSGLLGALLLFLWGGEGWFWVVFEGGFGLFLRCLSRAVVRAFRCRFDQVLFRLVSAGSGCCCGHRARALLL
mmetsp:Transcript_18105/g.44413  ORF Transcript_18105/g.44413 Transcript_18105/m.44413 type:complete len:216 (-) Transcript_18105:231-878(-)